MQRTIIAIAIALFVIAAAVTSWRFVDAKNSENRMNAVQECADVAAKSGTAEYPFNGGVYTICMDDKGIPSSVK